MLLFSVFQDVVVATGEGSGDKFLMAKLHHYRLPHNLKKKRRNKFLLLNPISRHTGGCSWDNLDTV
jgi:hypothetical protein